VTEERRKTTRANLHRRIYVRCGETEWAGTVKNISLRNVLVAFEKELSFSVSAEVGFSIPLAAPEAEAFTISGNARASRAISSREIAFEFTSLSPESYRLLSKTLTYVFQDESVVEDDIIHLFRTFTEKD
jgi:hypothetical protein